MVGAGPAVTESAGPLCIGRQTFSAGETAKQGTRKNERQNGCEPAASQTRLLPTLFLSTVFAAGVPGEERAASQGAANGRTTKESRRESFNACAASCSAVGASAVEHPRLLVVAMSQKRQSRLEFSLCVRTRHTAMIALALLVV